MKRQLERYFELFPVLVIILIMMAAERRQSKFQPVGFEFDVPSIDVQAPRIIFR